MLKMLESVVQEVWLGFFITAIPSFFYASTASLATLYYTTATTPEPGAVVLPMLWLGFGAAISLIQLRHLRNQMADWPVRAGVAGYVAHGLAAVAAVYFSIDMITNISR
jgi:hypothetical protein